RNADNGSGNLLLEGEGSPDAADLLAALDERAAGMAVRALEIFREVFPDAVRTEAERDKFLLQATARFEAILAVASQGAEVDEALVDDLEEVGAAAAWAGTPLPQLLVVLRISRDLIVQTAVQLAEERGRHWSVPLAVVLTRVLPAMDRLTDSIAQGWWATVVAREAEHKARYEHVVEHSSDGVYEVDLDGRVQYANASLALILGRPLEQIVERRVSDVVVATDGPSIESMMSGTRHVHLTILRPDGVRRLLEVRTTVRTDDGVAVGFQGVVRDVTAAHDLEADKNEFLALMTYDLRQPLTTILGLGATLESHAAELDVERVRRMGESIRRQAERMSRLADDLYDISRLEAQSLLLSPRTVSLRVVVDGALAGVGDVTGVEVDIPPDVEVVADPRRLEQVVANLVENAVAYGAPPIRLLCRAGPAEVELAVCDRGPGVPATLVPTLFDRLRLVAHRNPDRSRTGLGLALVRGLVEAMGGRVWYVAAPGGGAEFRLALPAPRARRERQR
ncbi:MAG TPA: PAS domain-containing sensor histidine kinase, partial [Acidimicrobiales bacterium]|nr:PAS domain-containing sensor histidine kinase [Acidimicrobiales bacterium]